MLTLTEGWSSVVVRQAEISQRDALEGFAVVLLTGRRVVWYFAIISRLAADIDLLALATSEEHSRRSACWSDKHRDSLGRGCVHQSECMN